MQVNEDKTNDGWTVYDDMAKKEVTVTTKRTSDREVFSPCFMNN